MRLAKQPMTLNDWNMHRVTAEAHVFDGVFSQLRDSDSISSSAGHSICMRCGTPSSCNLVRHNPQSLQNYLRRVLRTMPLATFLFNQICQSQNPSFYPGVPSS